MIRSSGRLQRSSSGGCSSRTHYRDQGQLYSVRILDPRPPSAQFAASSLRSLHAAAFAADTAEEAFSLGEHGEALFSGASPSERYWIQDRPAAAIADLDAVRRKSKLPRSAREAGFRDRLPRGCHGPFYALRAEADSASLSHLGRLAQLGEHQLDKLGVTGSSPVPPIGKGPGNGAFLVLGSLKDAGFASCDSSMGARCQRSSRGLIEPQTDDSTRDERRAGADSPKESFGRLLLGLIQPG